MRRVPRVLVAGLATFLAVAGLAGCRTSPNVAAYVGDETITVPELQAAVDARLRDDTVAAFAAKDRAAFTRQVLSLLVLREVHAAAADHYGVDEVTDGEALDYLTTLLGKDGVDQEFAQDAQAGFARADVIELARERMIQSAVARAAGKSEQPTDAVLRARYKKDAAQYAVYGVGYITVPDQPTADAVLAQLQAQPETYPDLAAAFPGNSTLPEIGSYAAADIPAFGDQVQATPPGSGFTTPVQQLGVVVVYVASVTPAPFEQVRDQVARSVESDAEKAGQQIITDFRSGMEVTVNPRYGVLKDQVVVPDTGGAVHILGDTSSAAASPSATTGG
jgi:peptidyl-prolyl cis-trans isomerase SurA